MATSKGFEKFYGTIAGACNYFKPEAPRLIFEGNNEINITNPNYYTTDVFTEKAIEFIDEVKDQNDEKPFFLYLSYNVLIGHCRLQKKILTSIEVIILKDGKNLGRKDIIA